MVTTEARITPDALGFTHPVLFDELTIEFPESVALTDDLLCEIAGLNEWLKFERDETGRLVVSPGPDYDSDDLAAALIEQIGAWNRTRLGRTLIPSTTLHLPDDNARMPDAGWLSPETAARARSGERPYPHVVPDFVVEVRSSTDSLASQREKMDMWMRNGVTLGWLVDPKSRTVAVYRPDYAVVEHQEPAELSAEPPCEGLTISFAPVWQAAR